MSFPKPKGYTDGRDRLTVRVVHRLERHRVQDILARNALVTDVEDFQLKLRGDPPLPELIALIRGQLSSFGQFSADYDGGIGYREQDCLQWAARQIERLWPIAKPIEGDPPWTHL